MRIFLVVIALIGTVSFAQAPTQNASFPPPPKVPSDRVLIIPASDVATAMSRPPGMGTTIYDGGTYAGAALKRTDTAEPPVRHLLFTEVYVIQSGSGTYTSGGTLVGPVTEHPGTPDGYFGTAIKGGEVHVLKAGDVVVVPPGVPHAFTKVPKSVAYFNIKFQVKK